MSTSLEVATALLRTPTTGRPHAVDNDDDDELHEEEWSPTRIMDFPSEDNEDVCVAVLTAERAKLVDQLALDPLSEAPQISPILHGRTRLRKVNLLPTLNEQQEGFVEDRNLEQLIPKRSPSPSKRKKNPPHLPKPTRSERVQEIMQTAATAAATGDEDRALKLYKRAGRLAEAEVTRLKGQLTKSLAMHPATLPSIQTRVQEDLREAALLAGGIKLSMMNLYERIGDYDHAIESCKDAKSIYKKQRKRCPGRKNPTAEAVDGSPPGGGGSLSSGNSGGSEKSIVWYVGCPGIDRKVRDASLLMERLLKAQASYEERRRMIADILMLRQEVTLVRDPDQRQRMLAEAETMALKSLEVDKTVLGKNHPQVADSLQLLSSLALERNTKGSRERAFQYLARSLEINQKSLGAKHPRTGQDLLRMARLHQQKPILGVSHTVSIDRDEEDRAITYFRQAIEVFEHVKGGHKVVGSILNDLSVIYVARQELRTALELLEESLDKYSHEEDDDDSFSSSESSAGGTFAGIAIEVVQVWRNMGECYSNLRDFVRAAECFTAALDVQRDARQRHDSVMDSDLDSVEDDKTCLAQIMLMINDESIADTMRRLGKSLTACSKFDEATTVLQEAVDIHRVAVNNGVVFAATDASSHRLAEKKDQLANTLYCVAEVHDATGDNDAAIKTFSESLQLRISSDGHRATNERCNMVHCAMCLVGIAKVQVKVGNFIEAYKLYTKALFFCEVQGLPFSHSIVAMIERNRTGALRAIQKNPERSSKLKRLEVQAENQCRKGQFDAAIVTLSEAMTIRQTTVDKIREIGLDASSEIAAVVRLLLTCGQVFSAKGDKEKAQQAQKDAMMMQKKITATKASA